MLIKYKEGTLKRLVDSCKFKHMASSSYRVCLSLLVSVSADHTTENFHRLVLVPPSHLPTSRLRRSLIGGV